MIATATDGRYEPFVAVDRFSVGDVGRVSLRALSAEGMWLSAAVTGGEVLYWMTLGESRAVLGPTPVAEVTLGPVRIDGRWAWVRDGQLETVPVDVTALDAEPIADVPWTCLRARGDRVFACVLPPAGMLDATALYEVAGLGPEGPVVHPLFSIGMIGGPRAECGGASSEAERSCSSDWLHYGGEAGLLSPPPMADAGRTPTTTDADVTRDAAPRPGGGCAVDGTRPPAPWIALALMFFLGRRTGRSGTIY
jgi:hypothetical protein